MTIAEIVLLIAAVLGLSFLFRPVQKKLERILLKYFRAKNPKAEKPIIDITDYTKKKDN
jgi:hypothetical protein